MAQASDSGGLAEFAEAEDLEAGTGGPLPTDGALLERGPTIDGAAHGTLPGGRAGTIAHTTYTTRSDDTTTTHRHTAVVMRVPEAIGYAPFLQLGRASGYAPEAKSFEPVPGMKVRADPGVDEGWLTELLSPAFCEWLQRSPSDFGAELKRGVLTVFRDGHLRDRGELRSLCEDAAKIAERLREEAFEEVESGGGAVAKAAAPDRVTRLAALVERELKLGDPPAHVESRLAESRQLAGRSHALAVGVVTSTILWMIGVNVIGGGIYGLLLNLPSRGWVILGYQVLLAAIIGPLIWRSRTSNVAKRASEEAFWSGYAESHDLTPVDPLRFAAEFAQAELPAQPVRVFEGSFGGAPGHLVLTGSGRTRGDQIALVRGPRGPIATTELNVSAPGISTKALDEHIATLVMDLETQPRRAAAA